jgi:hypothetical protein
VANLFTSQTPVGTNNSDGTPGITTATTIRFAQSGYVTGVRFYATTTVSGTYTGALWSVDASDPGTGTLLASKTMGIAPTGGAWNTIVFDTPVAVSSGVAYRTSVFSGDGRYVNTGSFFTADLVNGDITADADGDTVATRTIFQGAYRINATIGYPNSPGNGSSYFVDVEFVLTLAAGSTTSPYVVTSAPAPATARPVVARATLIDPPVLTTRSPVVVAAPAVVRPSPVVLLRVPAPAAQAPATATSGPLVVARMVQQRPATPVLLRSTLSDPPVLTTGSPKVVTTPPAQPAAAAILARNPQPDAPPVSGPTTAPVVVTAPAGPPAATIRTLRAHLQDPIVATPQPIVVNAPIPVVPSQPILARGSLADLLAGTAPLVVTAPPAITRSTPILTRTAAAAVAITPTATPGPIIVSAPRAAPRGLVALIRTQPGDSTPPVVNPSAPRPPIRTSARPAVLSTTSQDRTLRTATRGG